MQNHRAPICITRAMRIPRAIRSVAMASLLLVGFVGADERDHGLTILSASPEQGLAGIYTTADSTILFETARAALPKNRKRARAHKVEVSVRIRYAEGDLLAELSQGDAPAHWQGDGVPTTPRTVEEVNTAVSAARGAIAALREEVLDPALAPELAALAGLADPLSMTGVEEHDAPSLTSLSYITSSLYYRNIARIHKHCIQKTFWGDCLAEHGAVRTQVQQHQGSGWVVVSTVDMCNHGACPSAIAFRIQCNGPSVATPSQLVNNHVGCSTSYDLSSKIGHNSNDDVNLEKERTVSNVPLSTSAGDCKDGSTQSFTVLDCVCNDWAACP